MALEIFFSVAGFRLLLFSHENPIINDNFWEPPSFGVSVGVSTFDLIILTGGLDAYRSAPTVWFIGLRLASYLGAPGVAIMGVLTGVALREG